MLWQVPQATVSFYHQVGNFCPKQEPNTIFFLYWDCLKNLREIKALKNLLEKFLVKSKQLTSKLIPPVPGVILNFFSRIYGNSAPNLTVVCFEHKSVHDSWHILTYSKINIKTDTYFMLIKSLYVILIWPIWK